MANFVFNIAKGRAVELYKRVDDNDPSTARLAIVPLESSGLVVQGTMEDYDDLATLLAGTTNEQTTMGRKYLTDTELASATPDDTNNRWDLDIPDITWTGATGNALGALIVCYDPNGGGGDSAIVPLTHHDFSVTPDGSDIVAVISATGFYRAS